MVHSSRHTAILASLILGLLRLPALAGEATVSHIYDLSDFTGKVPYSDVRLHVDADRGEVYAALGNSVSIFNASGMQVYRFDLDPAHGTVYDLAVDESGDILLLVLRQEPGRRLPGWAVVRCDYRGTPTGSIAVGSLKGDFGSFVPNQMAYQAGAITLVSRSQLLALVIDAAGDVIRELDLGTMAGISDENRPANEIFGFAIDPDGRLLFTVPTQFRAVVVSRDGTVRSFGRPGSVPGSFGIVSGIAGDASGNVFVADTLRNVVMMFDRNLDFVKEFGDGSEGLPYLVVPGDLASDGRDRLYVTQKREEGVAVFRIETSTPENPSDAMGLPEGGDVGHVARTSDGEQPHRTDGPALPLNAP